jgi:hypothetical protein
VLISRVAAPGRMPVRAAAHTSLRLLRTEYGTVVAPGAATGARAPGRRGPAAGPGGVTIDVTEPLRLLLTQLNITDDDD